jgi:hypothetical protein
MASVLYSGEEQHAPLTTRGLSGMFRWVRRRRRATLAVRL